MEAIVRSDIEKRLCSYANATQRPGVFELEVRKYSQRLLDEGKIGPEELAEEYDSFRGVLADDMGREDLEDELLEVISLLVGWCGPHARLRLS